MGNTSIGTNGCDIGVCVCVCVCVCLCSSVCVCTHMCRCMHACVYVSMCAFMYVYMCICVRACPSVCVCVRACVVISEDMSHYNKHSLVTLPLPFLPRSGWPRTDGGTLHSGTHWRCSNASSKAWRMLHQLRTSHPTNETQPRSAAKSQKHYFHYQILFIQQLVDYTQSSNFYN